MDLAAERLHRTTVDIVAELTRDQGFAGEVLRAQREFFAGSPDYVPEGPAHDVAHGRFCEWFVLERESEHLGAVPVEAVGGLPRPVREALRASVCGLFLVEASEPAVRVRDVATDETLELQTDAALATGDVVVGRAYPGEVDALVPSPAAAILRQGQAVAAALQRDLQRAAITRRLTQAELEALLFRNVGKVATTQARRVPPERLEARLDSLLRAGGDTSCSAAEISQALDAAVEGPGGVMGPLLEALAFDTDVDLDAVRTTLLELWNEHRLRAQARAFGTQVDSQVDPAVEFADGGDPIEAARQPPAAPPLEAETPGLGATIAERIERGLANREDIEALFADVEGMLGDDDEGDDDGDDAAGTAQGDLDALVQEYLWERQLAPESDPARALEEFVAHQTQLPVPGVYLEAIPARELVSFLLRAYLTAAAPGRAAQVRVRFAALVDFYAWAEETQVYELAAALDACEQMVIEPLDRLHRASLALSRDAAGDAPRPRVLRVQQVEGGEIEVVGSDTEPTWIDAPEAAVDLRADDLMLAALVSNGRGGLRVVGPAVVLPAAAADLLE